MSDVYELRKERCLVLKSKWRRPSFWKIQISKLAKWLETANLWSKMYWKACDMVKERPLTAIHRSFYYF